MSEGSTIARIFLGLNSAPPIERPSSADRPEFVDPLSGSVLEDFSGCRHNENESSAPWGRDGRDLGESLGAAVEPRTLGGPNFQRLLDQEDDADIQVEPVVTTVEPDRESEMPLGV